MLKPGHDLRDAAGLIFAALFPTAAAWLYFVSFADAPFMPAVYAFCKIAQFSFPIAWVLLHGPVEPARAASAPSSRGMVMGALSGLAIGTVMCAVYVAMIRQTDLALAVGPRLAARIATMGAATPAGFIALTLFICVAHSFLEEYYWRWFVFGRMSTHLGDYPAIALSSVAFMGHHVIILHALVGPGQWWWMTVLLSAAIALGGGLWAWLYARTGSLISPWLSHLLVDLGIMVIGNDLAGIGRG